MADPFDLSASPIRTIEPLLTERLRVAFPAARFGLERIPAVLTVKEFERVLRLSPFLGLAFLGVETDAKSGRQLQASMRWRLVLVFKASRDLRTRFSGDAQDIGLDAMTDVAIALLQGAVFDGVGASSVTSAEAVYADGWEDDLTVVNQVDFKVAYSTSAGPFKLKTIDDFKVLGATWFDADADAATPPPGTDSPRDIEFEGATDA